MRRDVEWRGDEPRASSSLRRRVPLPRNGLQRKAVGGRGCPHLSCGEKHVYDKFRRWLPRADLHHIHSCLRRRPKGSVGARRGTRAGIRAPPRAGGSGPCETGARVEPRGEGQDEANNRRLLERIAGIPDAARSARSARFVCAAALVRPDGSELVRTGSLAVRAIADALRIDGGAPRP